MPALPERRIRRAGVCGGVAAQRIFFHQVLIHVSPVNYSLGLVGTLGSSGVGSHLLAAQSLPANAGLQLDRESVMNKFRRNVVEAFGQSGNIYAFTHAEPICRFVLSLQRGGGSENHLPLIKAKDQIILLTGGREFKAVPERV